MTEIKFNLNCCQKCGSKNLTVNGIFYVCQDCGNTDDSTFSMIEKHFQKKSD